MANGNILIIALNGTAIAGAKSADMDNSCETIEMASASQNTWKKFIAGRKEWTVSVGVLVATVSDAGEDLLKAGTTYTLAVKTRAGSIVVSGSAICTKASVKATRGSLMQGQFTFKGTDALAAPTQ